MVTLNNLVKLIETRRAELAELETAVRVLSQLNGHAKLRVIDRRVKAAFEPEPEPKPELNRFGKPYRFSKEARQRMAAAQAASHAKPAKRKTARRIRKPLTLPNIELPFEIPAPLREKWTYRNTLNPRLHWPITLAVIHYLREQGHTADWPTIATIQQQLGWKTFHQTLAQIQRWKSAKAKGGQYALTRLGEQRVTDAEQLLQAQ